MKRIASVVIYCVIVITAVSSSFAHPGRTDANGGHWNHSTGTYHYHTGEYAGREQSNSSKSTSDNSNFKPPYEPPPREEDTKSNDESQSDKPKETIWTKVLLQAGFWICILYLCLILPPLIISIVCYIAELIRGVITGDAEYQKQLKYITFVVMTAVTMYLITSDYIVTIVLSLIIFLFTYVIVKKIKNVKAGLNAYERDLFLLNSQSKQLEECKRELDESTGYSKLYEIGSDGLPKEKNANGWGDAFTIYITPRGKKIHFKPGCCGAYIKKHICNYRFTGIKNYCSKCNKDNTTPDMEWYYRIKKETDATQVLQQTVQKDYYECNKKTNRFILLFLNKERRWLKRLNELYKLSIKVD